MEIIRVEPTGLKINVKLGERTSKTYQGFIRCSKCRYGFHFDLGWRGYLWECPYCGNLEKQK